MSPVSKWISIRHDSLLSGLNRHCPFSPLHLWGGGGGRISHIYSLMKNTAEWNCWGWLFLYISNVKCCSTIIQSVLFLSTDGLDAICPCKILMEGTNLCSTTHEHHSTSPGEWALSHTAGMILSHALICWLKKKSHFWLETFNVRCAKCHKNA